MNLSSGRLNDLIDETRSGNSPISNPGPMTRYCSKLPILAASRSSQTCRPTATKLSVNRARNFSIRITNRVLKPPK